MLKYALVENALALTIFILVCLTMTCFTSCKSVASSESQGKVLRSAASEVRESHRDDSTFVYSKENVDRKTTESARTQKVKVSTSSLWLYIILALIVLLAVAGWIVKRKIGRFFSG